MAFGARSAMGVLVLRAAPASGACSSRSAKFTTSAPLRDRTERRTANAGLIHHLLRSAVVIHPTGITLLDVDY